MIVVGNNEMNENKVSVRLRNGGPLSSIRRTSVAVISSLILSLSPSLTDGMIHLAQGYIRFC